MYQLWFPVCGTTKYHAQRKVTVFFCKLKKIMFSILGKFTVVKLKIILQCIKQVLTKESKQQIPRCLWQVFVLVYVAGIGFR
jgi:hypothetical protein